MDAVIALRPHYKFLVDECLTVELLPLAREEGHVADHVVHMGWGGWKDWNLMPVIIERDYTFVTNNRLDFMRLHGRATTHAGLVIIIPQAARVTQMGLFSMGLLALRDIPHLINRVIEIDLEDSITMYDYP